MNHLPTVTYNASSADFENIIAAESIDWRVKGAVTPVKN